MPVPIAIQVLRTLNQAFLIDQIEAPSTLARLKKTKPTEVRGILESAGFRTRLVIPDTWGFRWPKVYYLEVYVRDETEPIHGERAVDAFGRNALELVISLSAAVANLPWPSSSVF